MKSYFPTVPGSCHVAPSVKDNIFPYRLRYSNMGSPLPAVGGDTLLTASPPPPYSLGVVRRRSASTPRGYLRLHSAEAREGWRARTACYADAVSRGCGGLAGRQRYR